MKTFNTGRLHSFNTFLHKFPYNAETTTWAKHISMEKVALAILTVLVLAALSWASLRVTAMPEAVPASAPLDQFSSARAFEHLTAIAQAPSPAGSAANAVVRDYIIHQIKAFGLTPEIQSTVAVHPVWSMAFQVDNVLVRLPGSDSTRAVLIVGHYDGIASGPGAGDNRLSNAAMLESIRTLLAREQLRNDIIFFFADVEEYGLVGAAAFVDEHPWAQDVGVVFNYDASTGQGPLVLQHTAEEDGWLVRNLVAADAGIFLKSQQNSERDERWGQDFDVFQEAGFAAANVNNWTNTAYYHTRLDNVDNFDERKLQAYGSSIVQLANHFGNIDLSVEKREGDHVFTSLYDKNFVVHYPSSWTWPLTLLTIVGYVSVVTIGVRRHRLSSSALVKSGAALLGFLIIGAILAEVAWSVIKSVHPEADWQQELNIYQGSLLLGGLTVLVVAGFIAFLAWGQRRFDVDNIQVAAIALVLLLAIYAAVADPLFSYLALWPLFAVIVAVGVSLFIPADRTGWYRWLRVGIFWLAAIPALGIFMPLLAQILVRSTDAGAGLPILVSILFAGLLVTLIDIVLPPRRYLIAGLAVVVAFVLMVVGMARSGFNGEQPQPHTLFYAFNTDTGSAKWVTLDDDPDTWLAQFVPADSAQATTIDDVLGIPATLMEDTDWLIPNRDILAANAPELDSPPPNLEVVADRRENGVRTLTLRVTSPRSGRVVYIVPEQEVVTASVEGKPIEVYPGWRFMFVGLPAEGIELQLGLATTGSTRLTVFDQTDGIPTALAARYSPETEDTMPAILPRWARGYPAFESKTFVFN